MLGKVFCCFAWLRYKMEGRRPRSQSASREKNTEPAAKRQKIRNDEEETEEGEAPEEVEEELANGGDYIPDGDGDVDEDEEEEFIMNRPKRTEKKRREPERYDEEEEQEEAAHFGNERDAEAEAGIIEKIRLENFMCHRHLELSFGPNINFIVGVNGSKFLIQ